MQRSRFIDLCGKWGSEGKPFVFLVDYEMQEFIIHPVEEARKNGLLFNVKGYANFNSNEKAGRGAITFNVLPMEYSLYAEAFDFVRKHIFHGNSFLLNLTFPTEISTDLSLEEIFTRSEAPYRVCLKDRFVVFSPETFVRIKDDYIYSYPMKGTMDAMIPGAEKLLMDNDKELSEHHTIVDLIRNDLSIVASDVEVTRFRYIDLIRTHKNELLQVSSEIRGRLKKDWQGNLGEIILKMLPAGSISGAPKKKTVEVIAEAERIKRGFFTGIFGLFDGKQFDSAVLIRFIEKTENGLRFRSGGGITGRSDPRLEYEEMLAKVYVPII